MNDSKPVFDPSKPFEEIADAKPKFDPSKPYDEGSPQEDSSYGVGDFARNVAKKVIGIPKAIIELPKTLQGANKEADDNYKEAMLTRFGKAADVFIPGARNVGAEVEHLATGEDNDAILKKYRDREKQYPASAALGSVAGQAGQTAALTAALGPAGTLLSIPTGDASQQYSDTGHVDPKTLAENTAAGLVIPGSLKAVEEVGPVVNSLTRKLAPAAAKEAAETFTKSPEAYTQAKQNATLAPKLQAEVTNQAQSAEQKLGSTLKAEKARTDDLYEAAKKRAKDSSTQVENPSDATSEQIRTKLEGALTDKSLAPVQDELKKAIDEVGISRHGQVQSPRQLYTPEGGTVPTVQYEPFTDGENMNMSVDFRKRIDKMLQRFDSPLASSQDKAVAARLKQLREDVDHKIKSAEDFQPDAHKLQGLADQEFAKASAGRKVVEPQLGVSLTDNAQRDVYAPNADKIAAAASDTSPTKTAITEQGLRDVNADGLLEPVRAAQKAVQDQQNLANLRRTVHATGPLTQYLPDTGTAINVGNGLTSAGKTVADSPAIQRIQALVRAQRDTANVKNDQKQQILQPFKGNPSAVGWLSTKANGTTPTVSKHELESASKIYGIPVDQLQDALIKLGKQVEP